MTNVMILSVVLIMLFYLFFFYFFLLFSVLPLLGVMDLSPLIAEFYPLSLNFSLGLVIIFRISSRVIFIIGLMFGLGIQAHYFLNGLSLWFVLGP